MPMGMQTERAVLTILLVGKNIVSEAWINSTSNPYSNFDIFVSLNIQGEVP